MATKEAVALPTGEAGAPPAHKRDAIEVVFAEPQANLRTMLRTALRDLGYTALRDYSSEEAVRSALEGFFADLLIIDAAVAGPRCAVVHDIRHGTLGLNPFVTVIVTTFRPDADIVRAAVDAGCDDLLVKPLSPAKLRDRIRTSAFNRRPFIVTHDYIGPDRRREITAEHQPQLVAVPNTLGWKERGETVDPGEAEALIAAARREINDQRLKRNAFQIAFLVGLILPDYERREPTKTTLRQIRRLGSTAEEVSHRMVGTPYEHLTQVCDSVVKVAASLATSWQQPTKKDLDLLKPLSDAMVVGFHPGSDSSLLASEIGNAIRGYKSRQT